MLARLRNLLNQLLATANDTRKNLACRLTGHLPNAGYGCCPRCGITYGPEKPYPEKPYPGETPRD